MNIEEFVIEAISGVLEAPVYGDRPSPMPARFHTVEKTGSRESEHVKRATITVQSWGETRAEAAELNELAKQAMDALITRPEISSVSCETDYNYPDLTSKKPRYQALYDLVYFL